MSQATKNKIFRAITYLLVLGTVLSATVFFLHICIYNRTGYFKLYLIGTPVLFSNITPVWKRGNTYG